MSSEERLTSLNCPTCAAPLKLLGGHQVQIINCGYCGSVIDLKNEFRVLAQYKNLQRPETPFQIGMQGKIKNVSFTVIGTIQSGYRDAWGDEYSWVSSQLYSPTHGYAWITVSDGHFVFSRRVRELPSPSIPVSRTPKTSGLNFRGQKFQLYEHYSSQIQFIEGELTWIAALGDQTEVDEYIAPPLGFAYEQGKGELEYGLSEYIEPSEISAAFDLDELPKRVGIHPIQPFKPGIFGKAIAGTSYWFAILAAIGLIYTFILGGGEKLVEQRIQLTPGSAIQIPFVFSKPNQLLWVQVDTNVSNNWTYIDAAIVDDEDRQIAGLGREIGYYHGYSGGESWSEGSRSTTATIKLPDAGNYLLEIEVDPKGAAATRGRVEIWQGYMPLRYFAILTGLFFLAAVSLAVRKWRFNKARWSEVLDDSDD